MSEHYEQHVQQSVKPLKPTRAPLWVKPNRARSCHTHSGRPRGVWGLPTPCQVEIPLHRRSSGRTWPHGQTGCDTATVTPFSTSVSSAENRAAGGPGGVRGTGHLSLSLPSMATSSLEGHGRLQNVWRPSSQQQ